MNKNSGLEFWHLMKLPKELEEDGEEIFRVKPKLSREAIERAVKLILEAEAGKNDTK